MARPQTEDGGDSLQVRRTTSNITNQESRTTEKKWSSSTKLDVGWG